MIDKSEFPQKYHILYDYNKQTLTDEAFQIWCDNVLNDKRTPYPENYLRKSKKMSTQEAIKQAREAVAGYSENNGARKAVELLADAMEGQA